MKPYSPQNYPPVQEWPTVYGPDCVNGCENTDDMTWYAATTDLNGRPVNLWQCGACCAMRPVPVTHWPVMEGPNCPVCGIEHTFWAAIAADHNGDLWMCEDDHEFVLTIEGLVIPSEDGGGSAGYSAGGR